MSLTHTHIEHFKFNFKIAFNWNLLKISSIEMPVWKKEFLHVYISVYCSLYGIFCQSTDLFALSHSPYSNFKIDFFFQYVSKNLPKFEFKFTKNKLTLDFFSLRCTETIELRSIPTYINDKKKYLFLFFCVDRLGSLSILTRWVI